MSEPNIPLLRKTMETILDNPQEWVQEAWVTGGTSYIDHDDYEIDDDDGAWALGHLAMKPRLRDRSEFVCGTAMCFAGHAATLAGHDVWSGGVVRLGPDHIDTVDVDMVAAKELGIDIEPAAQLFRGDNSIIALASGVHELTGGEVDLRERAMEAYRQGARG